MRAEYLIRNKSAKLIVIFAGWGSDRNLYSDVMMPGWDILLVTDCDATLDIEPYTSEYTTIYIYAWSLGVMSASRFMSSHPYTAAFAINGTPTPSHDLYGIPTAIYSGTADTLNMENLERFRRRMFSTREEYRKLSHKLPSEPDIDSLRNELYSVSRTQPSEVVNHGWTRAYISKSDRIFPAANQARAWREAGVETVLMEGSHFVDIQKIITSTIPNHNSVAKRFLKSLSTYDANATAQRLIAERLIAEMRNENVVTNGRVLEIGQGSGLSTRLFGDTLRPREMWCIDLYETPQIYVAPSMHYMTGDAEGYLAETEIEWDYIVSSSAIQWFTDPHTFIRNAAKHLSPSGSLVCATFTLGNLCELDTLRPSPMLYRTTEELRSWLCESFHDVRVESESIRLTFTSSKEAIIHLRRTGVGGAGKHSGSLSELLGAIPIDEYGRAFLTYCPAYLIASRPRK